jgi:hypothetical protein
MLKDMLLSLGKSQAKELVDLCDEKIKVDKYCRDYLKEKISFF